jgi:hypothetical protein
MECKFRALGLGKTHHMEESSGRVFDSGYEEAGAGRQAHRGNMAACGLLVTGKSLYYSEVYLPIYNSYSKVLNTTSVVYKLDYKENHTGKPRGGSWGNVPHATALNSTATRGG